MQSFREISNSKVCTVGIRTELIILGASRELNWHFYICKVIDKDSVSTKTLRSGKQITYY